jgi:predicted lipoprotein with Yx(FWY)xxD motif
MCRLAERRQTMRGRKSQLLVPLLVVLVAGVGVAMAAAASKSSKSGTVAVAHNGKYGSILVSSSGMTLYRFTPDKKNVSECTGACAKFWPPLLVKGAAKPTAGSGASASLVGTAMRSNGAHQVTYAGFPVYLYAGDKKAGDVKGEGFQKKWYVVSPKGALVMHAAATASTTTTKKKGAWG